MRRLLSALLFVLILVPSAVLAWRHRDMPQFGVQHDDSLYFVSAKAWAEGKGYRIESLPGEPFQTKYPPFYSLLLTGIWKLSPEFPQNLPLASLFAWLMLPPYILL